MLLQAALALALATAPVLGTPMMVEQQIRNGMTGNVTKAVNMDIDGGWYRFFFGPSGSKTTFHTKYPGWLTVSITDAFCAGESWDLLRRDEYLVTTPRVVDDGCRSWTDNPDVAFWNGTWSSTKFSVRGDLDLTLRTRDSPYKGGSAFIRFDSFVKVCHEVKKPFMLVTKPRVGRRKTRAVCRRVGGVPANLHPGNVKGAAESMHHCGIKRAWFGRLSLALPKKNDVEGRATGGCLAFAVDARGEATVEVVSCTEELPTLCLY